MAKAKGRLRGKQPKLSRRQEAHLVELWRAGTHTTLDLADLFTVARSTVYRTIQRAGPHPRRPYPPPPTTTPDRIRCSGRNSLPTGAPRGAPPARPVRRWILYGVDDLVARCALVGGD